MTFANGNDAKVWHDFNSGLSARGADASEIRVGEPRPRDFLLLELIGAVLILNGRWPDQRTKGRCELKPARNAVEQSARFPMSCVN